MIIHNSKLVPKGYSGITLFPFIFLAKSKKDYGKRYNRLINHEKIHLKQQAEMLIVFFYIVYIINYLINLVRYKNADAAYRNIIFEREAFRNEYDLNYLSSRKPFASLLDFFH